MKKYIKPKIQIQNIETDNILESSIKVYNDENDEYINDGSEILINKHSVWDE